MLNVTLICSDSNHPVYESLKVWQADNLDKYEISLLSSVTQLEEKGDILFLVSCSDIIREKHRALFDHVLVLHASDLPKNRGWSPHIWAIVGGETQLTLSLLEAEEPVDTGAIWKKVTIDLDGTELYDEINAKLFQAEVELISWACENVDNVEPVAQVETDSNYLRKRTPDDSEIDVDQPLSSQFNQLRVSDPDRFPAFFYMNGCKYKIKIERF